MFSQVAVATPAHISRAADRTSIPRSVAYVATCLLACAAPFEFTRPLITLPWQQISNLEALLLCAFICWLVSLAWSQQWTVWRTSLTAPWLALIAVMLVAA